MPDVSIERNMPDPDFDFAKLIDPLGKQPQPLSEVPAYASSPGEESPSVTQNAPDDETLDPDPLAQPEEEVPPGGNQGGQLPPSVVGTSQDPNREEP